MERYSVKDFDRQFPDDAACLEYLKNARWPDGINCRKCERVTKHHRVRKRACYECDCCGSQVYPLAGTIFHKSPTSLRSWFHAIFLMASTRCGISAKQLERELGVTYKTAWRMFRQIRTLMTENRFSYLAGEVEADETYIGGKRRGKRGRGAEGKSIVMGIAERNGKIKVKVIPNVKAKTLIPQIAGNVKPTSTVYTDELSSYKSLPRLGYKHLIVNHSEKVYVDGDKHTNTVDGFWSLVKRGIDGVHHVVSPKYLQAYLDSYAFRYNHRGDQVPMFKTLLSQVSSQQVARPF